MEISFCSILDTSLWTGILSNEAAAWHIRNIEDLPGGSASSWASSWKQGRARRGPKWAGRGHQGEKVRRCWDGARMWKEPGKAADGVVEGGRDGSGHRQRVRKDAQTKGGDSNRPGQEQCP